MKWLRKTGLMQNRLDAEALPDLLDYTEGIDRQGNTIYHAAEIQMTHDRPFAPVDIARCDWRPRPFRR